MVEGSEAPMDRRWQHWMQRMLLELHKSLVPPKGIVPCNLDATDISSYFDATGKGIQGTPYEWWAICNGFNDTPDLATDSPFLRHNNAAAGGTAGSTTSGVPSATVAVQAGVGTTVATDAHTHETTPPYYEFVFLMRLPE
jgi:hypothetical protein